MFVSIHTVHAPRHSNPSHAVTCSPPTHYNSDSGLWHAAPCVFTTGVPNSLHASPLVLHLSLASPLLPPPPPPPPPCSGQSLYFPLPPHSHAQLFLAFFLFLFYPFFLPASLPSYAEKVEFREANAYGASPEPSVQSSGHQTRTCRALKGCGLWSRRGDWWGGCFTLECPVTSCCCVI